MSELSPIPGIELIEAGALGESLSEFNSNEENLIIDFVGCLEDKTPDRQELLEGGKAKVARSFSLIVDAVTSEPGYTREQQRDQLITIYNQAVVLRAIRLREYFPDLPQFQILSHYRLHNHLYNLFGDEAGIDDPKQKIISHFETELSNCLEFLTAKKEGTELVSSDQKEFADKKPHELIEVKKYPSLGTVALIGASCFLLFKLKNHLAKGTE